MADKPKLEASGDANVRIELYGDRAVLVIYPKDYKLAVLLSRWHLVAETLVAETSRSGEINVGAMASCHLDERDDAAMFVDIVVEPTNRATKRCLTHMTAKKVRQVKPIGAGSGNG